jgi:cobalt-zinc-cadmium resistance protein CzcA
LRNDSDGTPVLVRHIAQVRVDAALRHGVITRRRREAVLGVTMMLIGANSRTVVNAVRKKVVDPSLPGRDHIEAI